MKLWALNRGVLEGIEFRVLGFEFRDIAKTGAIFNLARKRLWDKTPGHI